MEDFLLCDFISISGDTTDLLVTINYNFKLYHCTNFSFYKDTLFSTIYHDKILIFNLSNNLAELIHSLNLNDPKPPIKINNLLFEIDNNGTITLIT